jgi:PAS domain-containing protein
MTPITLCAETDHQVLSKQIPELLKLAAMISELQVAMIVTDAKSRIEWINQGFTRITVYRLDVIVLNLHLQDVPVEVVLRQVARRRRHTQPAVDQLPCRSFAEPDRVDPCNAGQPLPNQAVPSEELLTYRGWYTSGAEASR